MKRRMGKIGTKTTLLFILFTLILCLGISIASYLISYETYSDFYSGRAQETAQYAATLVDGDRIEHYLTSGETDEYYDALQKAFDEMKKEFNVMYLYIFSPRQTQFTYILEARLETDNPENLSALGDVYEYQQLELDYLLPDVLAQRPSTEKVIARDTGDLGQAVEAWAPIFNSDGEMVAMVEADLSLSLVTRMLNEFMRVIIIMASAIIIVMVLILLLFIRKIVTKPLEKLTESALDFASGDSLIQVDVMETGDEMQTLSEALGKMAQDIESYTTHIAQTAAQEERMETELSVAKDIKLSMLPRPLDYTQDFAVSAKLRTAKVSGGCFYDYFLIDNDHVCVVLCEVMGEGIPAALFTVVAKTLIKNQLLGDMPVNLAMDSINTQLFESNAGNMSVEALVGVLEIKTGRFSYVNAGENAPFILRNSGYFELLQSPKSAKLAETRNVAYRRLELTLNQGDSLFFYADGVLELENTAGERLGEDKLRALLNQNQIREGHPQQSLEQLAEKLELYGQGVAPENDSAMMLLKYYKGDRQQAEITVSARGDSFPQVQDFIKRQFAENGLGGAFFANVVVAVEELFVLARARLQSGAGITVRCSVFDRRVDMQLSYAGRQEDLLSSKVEKERDALAFLEKRSASLRYERIEDKNVLTASFSITEEG